MPRKYFQIFLHVLACLTFVIFALLAGPGPKMDLEHIFNPHGVEDLIACLLIIGFFYLNFYILIPRYYFTKKYGKYISICLLIFISIVFIPRVVFIGDHEKHGRPRPPREHEFRRDELRSTDSLVQHRCDRGGPPGRGHGPLDKEIFGIEIHHLLFEMSQSLSLFLLAILASLIIRIKNRLRQAEQEKVNAELSYLKAQINPHFLFNTLNSIYSLAIEKSDYTPTAVVKLSGMMRYVITESAADFVSLEKEINYIRDFVDLQKIRLGNTAEINFGITGNYNGNRIAPLILIAFIENAFKHGINPDENSVITIAISIEGNRLSLVVTNNKVNSLANSSSNNVGLENTINRLDMIYSSGYSLKFIDNENDYSVELKIELK